MSVSGARAKLKDAHRSLAVAWDQAKQSWDDPASRSLEKHHLELLESTVRAALGALDLMNEVLERVRRDCGDDS